MFIAQEGSRQRTLHVIMLGPREVGKTSLLASLYDQFQDVIGQTNLVLTANGNTKMELQKYREDLRRFARGLDRNIGLTGTTVVKKHLIELGSKGVRTPQLQLSFTDIPGEVLTNPDADPDLAARCAEALELSAVVFIAIDSPALMERDGALHDEVNKPLLVTDFVRDTAKSKPNLLVVLVPLKCEKYATSEKEMRRLANRVKESYRPLVGHLEGMPNSRCGVVLTPVQTVGSMVFSRFDAQNVEIFRLRQLGLEYAPLDTDQPLRWMLRFVINGYRNRKRGVLDAMYDWWTETDSTFAAAIRKFASGCDENSPGFEVLLRHEYLEVP